MDELDRMPDRLRKAREDRGLSRPQLEGLSKVLSPDPEEGGVSAVMIGKYERGDASPTAGPLLALCRALEVSPTWILAGQPPIDWPETSGDKLRYDIKRVARWLLEYAEGEGSVLTDDEMPRVDDEEEDGDRDVGTPRNGD